MSNQTTILLGATGEVGGHILRELLNSPAYQTITELIKQKYHVKPDFPWHSKQNQDNGVFRHLDSGKWFGLIMNIKRSLLTKDNGEQFVDVINLKSNSLPIDAKSVFPAYHMNHRYWISVVLDDRLSDDTIMKMIGESFVLTGQAANQ